MRIFPSFVIIHVVVWSLAFWETATVNDVQIKHMWHLIQTYTANYMPRERVKENECQYFVWWCIFTIQCFVNVWINNIFSLTCVTAVRSDICARILALECEYRSKKYACNPQPNEWKTLHSCYSVGWFVACVLIQYTWLFAFPKCLLRNHIHITQFAHILRWFLYEASSFNPPPSSPPNLITSPCQQQRAANVIYRQQNGKENEKQHKQKKCSVFKRESRLMNLHIYHSMA